MDVPIPAEFLERMRGWLGEDYPAFREALERPEEGLRVNPLRVAADAFPQLSPFPVEKLVGVEEGFVLLEPTDAGRHPYHAAGVYYLQDPGAMAVGALAGAEPGERILDLSAAPGGKATHLGGRMGGAGVLVANDVSRSRARELVRNIERCGIQNAMITAAPPERLAARLGPVFDRVLVDAPCSGESMFHKSPPAREAWSPAAVEGCSRRQRELVDAAARLVRPNGLLVYATCTFSREENEEVIEGFLESHPEFAVDRLDEIPGAEPVEIGRSQHGGIGAYRLWPHTFPGAGHFIARVRRKDTGKAPDPPRLRPYAEPEVRRLVQGFMERMYAGEAFDLNRLARFGDDVVLLPSAALDLGALPVLRSGLHVGSVLRGRFEPAHALALAPLPLECDAIVDLAGDDPRVTQYLEGRPIDAPGPDGWRAIAVDGFRLGWGKRVGGTVKNHYPKGLRRPG